jgi:hypothetical protein
MMSYQRVTPRDLFNEAKFLKCLGALAVLIYDKTVDGLTLEHDTSNSPGFLIDQDASSGHLYSPNLHLYIFGEPHRLFTTYNNKAAYPLYLETPSEDIIEVLDEYGKPAHALLQYLELFTLPQAA